MGIVVRQSIKSSIGYYLGVGLGAVNTLYVSTNFMDTSQLATSRLLLENGLIFAAFAHLGIPNICDRYLSKYKNKETEHHGFLLFLLVFGLLGFLIFTGLFYTFQESIKGYYIQKSPVISQNIILCVPITFIWTYILILETYIRGHQRIAIPVFLRETLFRLLNIILIIMLGKNIINFSQFLLLFVGAMFLIMLGLIIYTWKLGVLYLNPSFLKIKKEDLKTMLSYGSFLILGSIGVNLVYFLDRNILASELGATATSIFIVATYFSSVIEMPGKSIRLISSPLLAQSVMKQQTEKTNELYGKVAINSMLVGGLLLILVFANLESLLSIMPKAEIYKQGFWVVIILGTCKWIETSLAIATGLITLISSICKLIMVNQKFNIHPFTINTAKAIGMLSVCLVIGMLIPNDVDSVLLKLFIIATKSLLLILIFLFLLIKFDISEDFTQLQKTVTVKIKHWL